MPTLMETHVNTRNASTPRLGSQIEQLTRCAIRYPPPIRRRLAGRGNVANRRNIAANRPRQVPSRLLSPSGSLKPTGSVESLFVSSLNRPSRSRRILIAPRHLPIAAAAMVAFLAAGLAFSSALLAQTPTGSSSSSSSSSSSPDSQAVETTS